MADVLSGTVANRHVLDPDQVVADGAGRGTGSHVIEIAASNKKEWGKGAKFNLSSSKTRARMEPKIF
jgi:hypothetical protein